MTAMLGAGGKIVVKAPVIPAAAVRLQQCFPQVQHQHTGAPSSPWWVMVCGSAGTSTARRPLSAAQRNSRSCTSVSGIGHG